MKKKRSWARMRMNIIAIWLLCIIGLSAAWPAGAQNLPSSNSTPSNGEWGKWTKMTPSSFPGTVSDATRQCIRTAAASATDPLTVEKCNLFEQMLINGECLIEDSVPDGIRFDYMNARENGKSKLKYRVEKSLGRSDKAYICDLRGNVFGYWFTGEENKSCNNVAFVFRSTPAPNRLTSKWVCRDVPFDGDDYQESDDHYHLNSLYVGIQSCGVNWYIPSLSFHFGDENLKSNGNTEECYPINVRQGEVQ